MTAWANRPRMMARVDRPVQAICPRYASTTIKFKSEVGCCVPEGRPARHLPHRTASKPCRYNLPVVALSRQYSPQFSQMEAGTSRTMTMVLPRCRVTVTVPRTVSPSLQIIHFISVPRPNIAPTAECFGPLFAQSKTRVCIALLPVRATIAPCDAPTTTTNQTKEASHEHHHGCRDCRHAAAVR